MLNAEPRGIDFGKSKLAAAQVNGNGNWFSKLYEPRLAVPVFRSQVE
jgi:hypothetical protein